MTHRKVFRFRMKPTAQQRESLARMAGSRRYVWNWALAQRNTHYRETGKGLPAAELSARLTALKQQPETAWLGEVDSQAMQQTLADLQRAYVNFFEYNGVRKNISEWAKEKNLLRTTLAYRLNQGWSIQRALETPNLIGWKNI